MQIQALESLINKSGKQLRVQNKIIDIESVDKNVEVSDSIDKNNKETLIHLKRLLNWKKL